MKAFKNWGGGQTGIIFFFPLFISFPLISTFVFNLFFFMFLFLNLLSPIRPLFSFRVRCHYCRHWNIFEIMNAGRFAIMNFFVFLCTTTAIFCTAFNALVVFSCSSYIYVTQRRLSYCVTLIGSPVQSVLTAPLLSDVWTQYPSWAGYPINSSR